MLQFIGKFWGPEEIIDVKDTGTTTHRGVLIVEVATKAHDRNRVQTTTLPALEILASEEPKDWNYVQETKLDKAVNEIMVIATDSGITGGELQTLLAKLGLALATRFEHAAHIKFEGNDDEFVPGGSEFYTWSLAKAEHVITSSKNEQAKNS
jgi:hypothetical protein